VGAPGAPAALGVVIVGGLPRGVVLLFGFDPPPRD